jgi:hypothetical protein
MNRGRRKISEGEIIVQFALPAITHSAYYKGNRVKTKFNVDYTKILTENKILEEVLFVLDPRPQNFPQSALV